MSNVLSHGGDLCLQVHEETSSDGPGQSNILRFLQVACARFLADSLGGC